MNANHIGRIALCGLGVLLLIATAAIACDWWCVQGVIDWGPFNYGPVATVHKVYDGKWNLENEEMAKYAARDGFVFLPRDEDFDKDVTFGTLAGAGVLYRGEAASTATIDWYEVWAWADINGDGQANSYDQLKGSEQNWVRLFHKTGEPGKCDPKKGTANISNLLKGVDASKRQLQAGIHYLLLLRVHATRSEEDSGSSLQFVNQVFRKDEEEFVRLGRTSKLSTEGWSKTESPAKYISKTGNYVGVDDFEVLWVRVNNPPRGPGH